MNEEIIRKQIDMDKEAFAALQRNIEKMGYLSVKHKPATETSHFEITKYKSQTNSKDKITCVYDEKANVINLDGVVTTLDNILNPTKKNKAPKQIEKIETKKDKQKTNTSADNGKASPAKAKEKKAVLMSDINDKKIATNETKTKTVKTKKIAKVEVPVESKTTSLVRSQPAKKSMRKKMISLEQKCIIRTPMLANAPLVLDVDMQSTDSMSGNSVSEKTITAQPKIKPIVVKQKVFNIKNFEHTKVQWCVEALQQHTQIKVKGPKKGSNGEVSYELLQESSKIAISYTNKKMLSITGVAGKLFEDVKEIFATKSDIKLLKGYVPKGLLLLSESSKIDLSNGIKDMMSSVTLTDYSVLLTAPCRALEKLIFDLQRAQKINVKMIGQAYEKDDDGNYLLKSGYLKKINSVIYPEVMSSLYGEYFRTRNYFVHSDNSSETSTRGIANKQDAKSKLDKLINVIEYNCKKLLEIGFSTESE